MVVVTGVGVVGTGVGLVLRGAGFVLLLLDTAPKSVPKKAPAPTLSNSDFSTTLLPSEVMVVVRVVAHPTRSTTINKLVNFFMLFFFGSDHCYHRTDNHTYQSKQDEPAHPV